MQLDMRYTFPSVFPAIVKNCNRPQFLWRENAGHDHLDVAEVDSQLLHLLVLPHIARVKHIVYLYTSACVCVSVVGARVFRTKDHPSL